MFCWNCGRKNAEGNKFCGECGKALLAPEGVHVERDFKVGGNEKGGLRPEATTTEAGVRSVDNTDAQRNSAKLTNPLVEEPRVVHDILSPVEEPRVAPKVPITPASSETATRVRAIVSPPVRSSVEDTPKLEEKLLAVQSPASPVQSSPVVPKEDFTFVRPRVGATTTETRDGGAVALRANRITGPSFLGLSDEPQLADDGGSYLLDDQEDASGSSWRGYLALAFLIVIGILVLRQWTEMRGIASGYAQKWGLGDAPKKVNAKPTVSSTSSDQPSASTKPDNNVNPGAAPGAGVSPSQESAKAETPESLAGGKPENDVSAAKSSTNSGLSTASEDIPEESAATATKSNGANRAAQAAVVADDSQVNQAQKYLQGKGVAQDCNRGVSLLRSAARQPNPKARIQMAALYLSGHCVEQDLPQAYSWFAQAKELEPNNNWIERNLNSLWSKMTDQERKRVLR